MANAMIAETLYNFQHSRKQRIYIFIYDCVLIILLNYWYIFLFIIVLWVVLILKMRGLLDVVPSSLIVVGQSFDEGLYFHHQDE
jgi:hypothetical protein